MNPKSRLETQAEISMRGPQDQTMLTDGDPSSTPSRVLNPQFVEMLMGFPPGWTDCTASETPSCPSKPPLLCTSSLSAEDGV